MAKLLAKEAMLRHHRRIMRQTAIRDAILAKPVRAKHVDLRKSTPATGQRRAPETPSGEPTPERAWKAAGVSKTTVPPFNSQIMGPAQKFAKGLGPEVMLILERLAEVGALGESSKGLVSSYEGVLVDSSGGGYEHLAAVSRDAHEQFQAALQAMPAELRGYVRELVLEDVGAEISSARGAPPRRARSLKEIGQELSGYDGEQRALGAVSAALRIIAWCARTQLGFKKRK